MANPSSAADLLPSLGALWVAWLLFVAFVFSIVWPLLALSVVLNIRGIRKELRDIAEQLSLPSRRL